MRSRELLRVVNYEKLKFAAPQNAKTEKLSIRNANFSLCLSSLFSFDRVWFLWQQQLRLMRGFCYVRDARSDLRPHRHDITLRLLAGGE